MSYELGHPILEEATIRHRVRELGEKLSQDYDGKTVVCVGVLKGSVVFLADLVRAVDGRRVDVRLDFMAVSSYGSATESMGVVKILKDLDTDIQGCHVLLVEDIVDSGLTLSYLKRLLGERNPASLRVCVLLDKPERRRVEVSVDYRGFVIPDEFVVGYGLDYGGRWRGLPAVYRVTV